MVCSPKFSGPQLKANELEVCAVGKTLALINSKWKPIIIYLLSKEDMRFLELWRSIPGISRKILTEQLSSLVADDLVSNCKTGAVYSTSVYALTPKGRSITAVLNCMQEWGVRNLSNTRTIEEILERHSAAESLTP